MPAIVKLAARRTASSPSSIFLEAFRSVFVMCFSLFVTAPSMIIMALFTGCMTFALAGRISGVNRHNDLLMLVLGAMGTRLMHLFAVNILATGVRMVFGLRAHVDLPWYSD